LIEDSFSDPSKYLQTLHASSGAKTLANSRQKENTTNENV